MTIVRQLKTRNASNPRFGNASLANGMPPSYFVLWSSLSTSQATNNRSASPGIASIVRPVRNEEGQREKYDSFFGAHVDVRAAGTAAISAGPVLGVKRCAR